ncbi:NAD(P)-binding protein [Ascodesmis nigricans]|uniref:NAD(P)-binding protein n=1 Tax=Ascodesmis nigricans TaxID=341454 RepID=A0A4S2N7Y9_9PEZI|nr:NAD(P)-binding protein [Ascodesmis nigricans]
MDIRSTYGEKGRKKQVALFVGATSGLGLEAMKKWIFLLGEEGGKIYFVGRNKEVGEEIIEDFRRHHAHVPVTFIHSPDLSLLSESARVADIVASKESHLNLIVLSQGELDLSDAPTLTPEGLDRKLSLNVYSRYLIARRLIPLLLKSYEYEQSTEVNRRAMAFSPPRVISIFSPGFEGPINEDDLSLSKPENYSMKQCIIQSAAMNSLMMEQLSNMYPGLGWIHVYPGIVRTNITRNMPEWIKTTAPVVGLFVAEKAAEVKEGIAYLATRKRAGLQLVDWHGMSWDSRDGESHGNLWDVGLGKYLGTGGKWWREGLAEKIWQHQEEVEKRVLGEQ